MRARGLLFGVALLFVLLSAGRALACSCMAPGPPCRAFGAAAATFVGTVTDVKTRQPKEGADGQVEWGARVFTFTVVQPFSGVEGTEVEVSTGLGGGDCGYGFRKGETYLVYAYGGGDGKGLGTGICTRTRPVSEAAEDLEYLRGLAGRPSGVSLDITVARSLESVKAGDSKPVGGLAGARLTVEGMGESTEVKTDAQGRARLTGLKPGTYKVRLSLPEELTTYKTEQEVTVNDRGCASVFYGVSDNGRVGGKVTDVEGKPAARILVTLVEADDPESEGLGKTWYERTGEDGRYAFEGVPPGRYLLAVNLIRYPEPEDATDAYARTYYPGVALASQAEAVTLGAGEAVKDRDILVPPRRAESVVEGVVVWEDGSSVSKPYVTVRETTYQNTRTERDIQSDEQGRFRIKGYQGQTLLIRAGSSQQSVSDYRRDERMKRSRSVRVTLANPTETVKIVITKLR